MVVLVDLAMVSSGIPCPLCTASNARLILDDAGRRFHQCADCDLIFLDPAQRSLPLDEVVRYLDHENDRHDPAYLRFLRRLADPVCDVAPPGARGLDFGCGPVPLLAEWLTSQGRETVSYDPVFFPHETLLDGRYDFITCSEVVEHAHDPLALFARMGSLVANGGWLAVMTRHHGVEAPFETWWYRRDHTHVCFFSERTMRWLAQRMTWTIAFPAPNVAIFTTSAARAD